MLVRNVARTITYLVLLGLSEGFIAECLIMPLKLVSSRDY